MPLRQHFQRHGAKWCGAGVGLCVAFLMAREGYEPVARHERIDPPGVITWCFGRTNYDDPGVKAGTRFSKAQCEKLLAADLPKYAAPVQRCMPGFDAMPPSRQAALVSFAYNLGAGRLCASSVAMRINAGDIRGGCNAMLAWDRANGRVIPGLVKRRLAERRLCLEGTQ